MAQRSILEEIMRRRSMLEKKRGDGEMRCEGEKRGSSATDQNTALRVRAMRAEERSKQVDKQVREGRTPEKQQVMKDRRRVYVGDN